MRFTRLIPRFNIIKRFYRDNNLFEQIPKNTVVIKDINTDTKINNIVSKLNDNDFKINNIDVKLNNIDVKLNDIDTKVKNMDAIIFSLFCIWNVVYFPIILYLI